MKLRPIMTLTTLISDNKPKDPPKAFRDQVEMFLNGSGKSMRYPASGSSKQSPSLSPSRSFARALSLSLIHKCTHFIDQPPSSTGKSLSNDEIHRISFYAAQNPALYCHVERVQVTAALAEVPPQSLSFSLVLSLSRYLCFT